MVYEIRELLLDAYAHKASDLHITVNSPPIFRINGKLVPYGEIPLKGSETEKLARSLMSEADWQGFLATGELDFSYAVENVARFRVNVYKQKAQVGFAARVIPNRIPTIEELNLPPIIQDLAKKPQGLILVTGPTGSGKSTTLAAMIDHINQAMAKHIVTLEDPIEYIHQHQRSIVHQREVGIDTKTFARGLRAVLRQDPDVILVGEMRDLETISTAITAAETGHLVLATLHTNSAAETINRIIDVFPAYQQPQIRIQLASVLEAVISQRLLVQANNNGRIVATEILINSPSVANLIRSEKVEQIQNIMQTSRQQGMKTLEMSINALVASGTVTMEEALPYLQKVGER